VYFGIIALSCFLKHATIIILAMLKNKWYLLITMNLLFFQSFSQSKVKFTFHVKDQNTQKPIFGASVFFSGYTFGAISDTTGQASLYLAKQNFGVSIRAIGYKLKTERINTETSTDLVVFLVPDILELEAVNITAEKQGTNVQRIEMGVERLSGKTLKVLPKLMGEADVIRSLMLLPGVSTVGDGASGFNVRGGNVDQNLVLLDGVPLNNSSHLFGFFTAFNADIVQDVSLYKGGISAKYGGRSSSVLDVRLKEGDFTKWSFEGGVGPIASHVVLDGPIVKDRTSLSIGTRGSFSDFYLKYFPNKNLSQSRANFYDINAKITHKIGKNQRLSLSLYTSKDDFKFAGDTLYFWQTSNYSLKHNWLIGPKLSHNFSAFKSFYNYGIEGKKENLEFIWNPAIYQTAFKEDLEYTFSEHKSLLFGGEFNFYENITGDVLPTTTTSIVNKFSMQNENAREWAVYVSNSNRFLNQKLSLEFGVRYAHYDLLGPLQVLAYRPDVPRTLSSISDTLHFSKGNKVYSFGGFEPRLSASFMLSPKLSVKVGYNRMRQFRHLLSNTMAISPADLWKNSNANLPPQVTDQFSLGLFKDFEPNENSFYESSVEIYYKNLPSLIDYKDGASLFLNPTVETELLIGKGNAYGAEVFLKKVKGIRLTGWVSYTYSRSFRTLSATPFQDAANFGLSFPANFDSPHSFKSVLNYRMAKRVAFNSTITFNSGRPITFPNGKYKLYNFNEAYDYMILNGLLPRPGKEIKTYEWNGQTFTYLIDGIINENLDGYATPSYTRRNSERIPAYMRMDVSLNVEPREEKKFKSSWSVGVYNVLGRQNVYSIYFKSSTGLRNQAKTYKMSVLGAAIPSVSYNFKF
jgi:TonB-dependent Receptor Plug Domain/CarboxypepD_reg-like domain